MYVCQSQSSNLSLLTGLSLVSICLFCMSVPLFPLCKLVHLYQFSRFHVYVLIFNIFILTNIQGLSDLLHKAISVASVCKIDYGRWQGKVQGDPQGAIEEAQVRENDGLELIRSSQTSNKRQAAALLSNSVCIQFLSSGSPILWSDCFSLNPLPASTHLWPEMLHVKQQLLSRVSIRLLLLHPWCLSHGHSTSTSSIHLHSLSDWMWGCVGQSLKEGWPVLYGYSHLLSEPREVLDCWKVVLLFSGALGFHEST